MLIDNKAYANCKIGIGKLKKVELKHIHDKVKNCKLPNTIVLESERHELSSKVDKTGENSNYPEDVDDLSLEIVNINSRQQLEIGSSRFHASIIETNRGKQTVDENEVVIKLASSINIYSVHLRFNLILNLQVMKVKI